MSAFPDKKPDEAIRDYVKFKARKDVLEAELKEIIAALPETIELEKVKSKLDKIESFMLMKMQENGTDQLGVKELGTFHRQVKEKYSIADYTALTEWMADQEEIPFMLFNRALNGSNVKEVADVVGYLPPGINTFAEEKATFYKSKGK